LLIFVIFSLPQKGKMKKDRKSQKEKKMKLFKKFQTKVSLLSLSYKQQILLYNFAITLNPHNKTLNKQ